MGEQREVPTWEKNRRAIFAICNKFRLLRGDRLEVATVILNRNVDSYSDLDARELSRLRDAFEGAALVAMIQIERRNGERV